MRTNGSLLTVVLLGMTLHAEQAASKECQTGSNQSEIVICSTPRLSALDSLMNSSWKSLTKSARQEHLSDQKSWLVERDKCLDNSECLETKYTARLSEKPFDLKDFHLVELYDFKFKKSDYYLLIDADGGAYNREIFIYSIDKEKINAVEWLLLDFDEDISTCDAKILDGRSMNFYNENSALGWIDLIPQGYADKPVNFGEITIYQKWIGYGDISSEVTYRLEGGQIVPMRGFIDNCFDGEKKFAPIYFK